MKKIFKLLAAGCLLLAVVSLSSCLSESNDNSNVEREWQEWVKAFQAEVLAAHGNYAGFIYYQPDTKVSELDSVAAEWNIVSDTILVLNRVPTSLFVEKLSEKQQEIKDAISAVGTADIQVKIGFNVYYKSPLLFYVYPEPVKLNITIGGQHKTAIVNFYDTEYYDQTFGQCLVISGQCLVRLIPKSIVVDGVGVKNFDTIDYAQLYWLGKKR